MADTDDKFTDKQGNAVSLEELMKGKSPPQQEALKYFLGIPIKEGCFKKEYLTGETYLGLIQTRRDSLDLKERALQKLGIDEDEVTEIEPVCFEGFREDDKKMNPYVSYVGNQVVSSMYEVTWLFFGDEQLYLYHHAFDSTDDSIIDSTQEYFYKDITAFSTSSDSIQKKVWVVKESTCSSTRESEMRTLTSDLFRIVVPGEVFLCAYTDDGESTQRISAMKQKLREKKC
jgi:hypothetical protein